jgi:hypothetical protein
MVRFEIRSQYFLHDVVGLSHLVGDEGVDEEGSEEGGGGRGFWVKSSQYPKHFPERNSWKSFFGWIWWNIFVQSFPEILAMLLAPPGWIWMNSVRS